MWCNEIEEAASALDNVLEVCLRPLHNLNTREIFTLLNKLGPENEAVTTLDVQRKLEEQGIRLSKKEINLSLHYLTKAGLVERLPQRGKPTIVEYGGRYSFDLWRIREKGKRIYKGLTNMILEEGTSELLDLDEKKFFSLFEELSPQEVGRILETLSRLAKITSLLSHIFKTKEEEMSSYRLERLTGIHREEVESLLNKISGIAPELPHLVDRRDRRSSGPRILRALGLSWGRRGAETFYCLTEVGRRYATMMVSR